MQKKDSQRAGKEAPQRKADRLQAILAENERLQTLLTKYSRRSVNKIKRKMAEPPLPTVDEAETEMLTAIGRYVTHPDASPTVTTFIVDLVRFLRKAGHLDEEQA